MPALNFARRSPVLGILAASLLVSVVWLAWRWPEPHRKPNSDQKGDSVGARAPGPMAEGVAKRSRFNPDSVRRTTSDPSGTAIASTAEFWEEFRRLLAAVPPVGCEEILRARLPGLILQDPPAAAAFAASLRPVEVREMALQWVVRGWADLDAERALAWAAALPEVSQRESVLATGYLRLAENDPRRAVELLTRAGPEMPADLAANLVQQWAEKDWVAAAAWLRQNPAPNPQEDQRMARLAWVVAKTAPAAAADLVVSQIPAGPGQTEAAISVIQQWALRDWSGAQAWVAQFPEGEIRARAMRELEGIALYRSLPDPRPASAR